MDYTQVLIKPLINEKVTFLKEDAGQVAFIVHKDSNKIQIKKAVETAIKVKVEAVNVVVKKPLLLATKVSVSSKLVWMLVKTWNNFLIKKSC